jgi:hypothetical protein
VDEVANIQEIAYERKRKVVMRRKTNKRKITLDSTLLITIEETLFDTENSKMIELIGACMSITNATLDREKRDEREVDAMKKELYHLRHQVEYYQNSTQIVVLLKSEFREMYAQFTRERDLFTAHIVYFQEYTLMGLETYKYM